MKLMVIFALGLVSGLILGCLVLCEVGLGFDQGIPEDLSIILKRLRFVNAFTGEEVTEFKVLGKVIGSYEAGGEVYETYVLGFEDRPGGAAADQDYLDVIVEFKRIRGSSQVTVRIVQLGYDKIDVYLDGVYVGSIRPALEFTVT